MASFKSFDESLFREFKSTTKEGLSDIAANEEEIDKIEFEVSESRKKVSLRVDYGDFANHIFYGSAFASVNFALARIINDYPLDGELKEKNEWRRVNSGYENYFFEEYPKRQGFVFFETGSLAQENWVEFIDHEQKLQPGTGSIAVDMVVQPDVLINETAHVKTLFSYKQDDDSEGVWAYFQSPKVLTFEFASGSSGSVVSASYEPYVSQSHALSFVYDALNNIQSIYLDGEILVSKSMADVFPSGAGELTVQNSRFRIGAMSSSAASTTQVGALFTGAVDDVRVWVGPLRKPELIKRNFFKTTHANVSGGLKLYWKFNESEEIGTRVFDYSGNENHGELTGTTATFSFGQNIRSGTLGEWFKDQGDPIFALNNSLVDDFITTQRASGSLYDRENRNYIFRIIPSFFIDEGDVHEDMQRFLLLIARHYDRLKLYIRHLSNVYNTDQGEADNTPDDLIGLVAEHYGMDLGSVYEGAGALQYFFGEDVLPTGSLDVPVQKIRNQLRRNLLSNLMYIIKTKSTREALEASIRSLGLDEEVVNINEYSVFSGGIEPTRTFRTVERKVADFTTGSVVFLREDAFWDNNGSKPEDNERSYEVRVQFNTASLHATSSVFSFFTGSPDQPNFYLEVERNNSTGSLGTAKLYFTTGAVGDALVLSSSNLELFDNKWINFGATIDTSPTVTRVSLHVNSFDRDEIAFSESVSGSQFHLVFRLAETGTLGTRSGSSALFDGRMQEFRAWNGVLSQSIFVQHTKDFESLETPDFSQDFDRLLVHHKLNDFTGSTTGIAPLHDYACGISGTIFSGISNDIESNFPGVYLTKLEPAYSYDIAINKDKIRIRDRDNFTVSDVVQDVPYLSVDMSPTVALNKEILKWFGDIDKFNKLIGQPFLRYREEVDTLNHLRANFFKNRLNSKINFDLYLKLLKWFDSNFTFFLQQLLPLDVGSSLSNFVVESHLLEFNQVPRVFPYKKGRSSTGITGSIDARTVLVALTSDDLPLADPGRFGAAVSASAVVNDNNLFDFTASLLSGFRGLNFINDVDRRIQTDLLQEDSASYMPDGYGNGWYSTVITGANYFKQVLNVDSTFNISGVHFLTGNPAPPQVDDGIDSQYLTSTFGRPENLFFTGAINGVQDQRWLWYGDQENTVKDAIAPKHDHGIGYGGVWGQLWKVNNKSVRGTVLDLVFPIGAATSGKDDLIIGVGGGGSASVVLPDRFVRIKEETDDTKTFVLWPRLNLFEPIRVVNTAASRTTGSFLTDAADDSFESANVFGERIPLTGGFKHLDIVVSAKRLYVSGSSGFNDTPIKFKFYFQFFDKDLPGPRDFETTVTSSIIPNSFFNKGAVGSLSLRRRVRQIQEFEIEQIALSETSSHDFVAHLERELPRAKFMRTFVRVEFPQAEANNLSVGYKVQVKGTLHKETTEVQRKFTET